ncbi:MAG: penicillin-binding protein 2 [Oscillospiraceae bacterium]|nr:penicillin-binding protein 2 [Oscillospiraceae bacterium]
MEKRSVVLFAVLILLFVGIYFRIYALTCGGMQAEAAAGQGRCTLEVYRSRGIIYDCRGTPLVNSSFKTVGTVLPGPKSALALKGLFPDGETWLERMRSGKPFALELADNGMGYPGVEAFQTPVRYGENQLAVHTIGYTDGEGKGMAGVERAYDELLAVGGEKLDVSYEVNALGQALAGGEPEINLTGEALSGVRLTLDARIQRACEEVMKRYVDRGAAVVMEADTGKLRAVVSLPDYDPADVADFVDREDSPFINRAFSAYAVGSTFKLLTAAAALEEGISPERTYECRGYIDVEGQIFKCNNLAGHGEMTMETAVEYSCNTYFIDLALELGGEALRREALSFGFSRSDLIADRMETASGSIPSLNQLENPAELGNFGFGQGVLTATPVQIAKLTAVFANGGYLVTPRLIEGTVDAQGNFSAAEGFAPNRVTDEADARKIGNFMRLTVEEGTGVLAAPEQGGAGGKTASAQTGILNPDTGEEIVHAWFSGFFPAEAPKYVLVVFMEDGQSGNRAAAPVFKEIADRVTQALAE